MASFLYDRALFGISRWHGELFTDSGFWMYSWAHLVMSMTESCRWVMQCHLRSRRPRASYKSLWPCSICTEISPVSLNLLIMLFTVDYEIRKAFAIWCWGTFHNLFTHSFTDWSTSAYLYFWETLFSKTSLLLLIMLQTWCQLTELVSRCSPSWIFSNSLVIQPFVAPVPNLFYL